MHGQVVIVGAGHAGVQVADSLRGRGYIGSIHVISEEREVPYQRPPLSKDFVLTDDASALPLRAESFYSEQKVELMRGVRAVAIHRGEQVLELSDGVRLPYSHLVLATGAMSRDLPAIDPELLGVRTLRVLDDACRLRDDLANVRRAVVVGAGFIGLEFAAAARKRGIDVTVIEAAGRALSRSVSLEMADHLVEAHRAMGTEVLLGHGITGVESSGNWFRAALTERGDSHRADLLVLGVGVHARDELARACGLAVNDGVVVDAQLRTTDESIFAVGDCASFPFGAGPQRMLRLESVQNAADQGRHVAGSILGDTGGFEALPLFWSNQGSLRLQIAGLASAADESIILGDVESSRFSVLRFHAGRLTAVESLNKPADHMAARRVLASDVSLTTDEVLVPDFDLKKYAQRLAVPAT